MVEFFVKYGDWVSLVLLVIMVVIIVRQNRKDSGK